MARKNLKKWEIDHGYRSAYVAEKLGIAPSTWSNIKSGRKNPTYETLVRFQKEFAQSDVISLFAED